MWVICAVNVQRKGPKYLNTSLTAELRYNIMPIYRLPHLTLLEISHQQFATKNYSNLPPLSICRHKLRLTQWRCVPVSPYVQINHSCIASIYISFLAPFSIGCRVRVCIKPASYMGWVSGVKSRNKTSLRFSVVFLSRFRQMPVYNLDLDRWPLLLRHYSLQH